MACLIRDGKFYTTDGKESVLYKELENKVGEVEARELFLLSHTPTFKESVKPSKEVIQVGKSKIYFKERVLPNKKKTGEIELELIETPLSERGKGTARKALENFLKYTDSLGKNVYLFASPRDRQTSESKLIKFYESLGFRSLDSFLPQEMTRKAKKVSKGEDIPQPTSENFYPNGEVKAEEVINYAEENFKPLQPLSEKEKVDLVNLDIQGVETSDELYHELYNAFYDKDGMFKPNPKKMRKIYSESEINNILENVEVQAKVKETIERLRNTEEFDIVKIEVDENFTFKTLETNSIGQYKTNNPLQEKELFEKENELNGYVKIPTINEYGEVIQEKLIYDNAVKFIDNGKIKTAVNTIVNAHPQASTEKLEAKVQKWLLEYGLDVRNLLREDYTTLNNFINNPSEENTIALEQALGFERKDKQTAVKIENTNRSYRYLKTTKSEEQLFDELSLIQTNEPNVYHQVNKIDEQEMRDIMSNSDLTIPIHELYKEYYGYGIKGEVKRIKELSIADGTFMKAPNGKKTNLSEDNWLFVRTQTFKNWFGDWQTDPQNSSKVVDKNGEPLITYRSEYSGEYTPSMYGGIGVHTVDNKKVAEDYHKSNKKLFEKVNKINLEEASKILPTNIDELNAFLADSSSLQKFIESTKTPKSNAKLFSIFSNLKNPLILNTEAINDYVAYVNSLKNASKNTKDKLLNNLKEWQKNTTANIYKLIVENNDFDTILDVYINGTIFDTGTPLNKANISNFGYLEVEPLYPIFKSYIDSKKYDGVIRIHDVYSNNKNFENADKEIVAFRQSQIKTAEEVKFLAETDNNDIRRFQKAENKSQIAISNTETDINYLMDEFVADFSIEKLKNPNDEFLNQFKITESGIEMVSQDETSLAKVKAGISNYPQLADYSLISKNLPNLKEANPYQIQTKESKRVQAVNNKHNIPTPKTEVKIIDNDFVEAKNETADFIKIGEDIYEQQEQGIYSKLQFEENPNYYVMKVEAPKYKLIEQNEIKTEDKTVKSMISKEQNDENFGCL